jgi:hypothetical protein
MQAAGIVALFEAGIKPDSSQVGLGLVVGLASFPPTEG